MKWMRYGWLCSAGTLEDKATGPYGKNDEHQKSFTMDTTKIIDIVVKALQDIADVLDGDDDDKKND